MLEMCTSVKSTSGPLRARRKLISYGWLPRNGFFGRGKNFAYGYIILPKENNLTWVYPTTIHNHGKPRVYLQTEVY
jgi:hypothetical protein